MYLSVIVRPVDVILKLVSIAENSDTNWRSHMNYIENIKDGRGFTIGIVGFCTNTGDFIQVLQLVKKLNPKHPLVKFIPAVQAISHSEGSNDTPGCEDLPQVMQQIGPNDKVFNLASWAIVDKLYWGPAKAYCEKNNLKSRLAYYIAYDTILNLGDLSAFQDIKEKDEKSFLSAFLDIKSQKIQDDHTLGSSDDSNNRVGMQKKLLQDGNMNLDGPMTLNCYESNFQIQ